MPSPPAALPPPTPAPPSARKPSSSGLELGVLSDLEGRGGVGATANSRSPPGEDPEPIRDGVPTLTASDGDFCGDEFGVPLAEKEVATSLRGEPNGVPLAELPLNSEPSR